MLANSCPTNSPAAPSKSPAFTATPTTIFPSAAARSVFPTAGASAASDDTTVPTTAATQAILLNQITDQTISATQDFPQPVGSAVRNIPPETPTHAGTEHRSLRDRC